MKGDENYEAENETPGDALEAAQERFEYQLERSRMGDGDGSAARWIGPMTGLARRLRTNCTASPHAGPSDPIIPTTPGPKGRATARVTAVSP